MDRQHLRSKFRGTLLGVAVGDALGAPFEGAPTIAQTDLARLVQDPGPLRYTDDTHLTLGLAQSLIDRPWFDGAHLAQTFAHNFAAEPWRGHGAGPPQIFRLIEQGVPWQEAGSACSISPVASSIFGAVKEGPRDRTAVIAGLRWISIPVQSLRRAYCTKPPTTRVASLCEGRPA
jgi:ADP-ribosylglycohydrolase